MRFIASVKRVSFWNVIIFGFIVFAFFVNALHESYPDEFDNILGGWYILQGRLPYIGFFTHHGPVPYFIASIVALFSGESFVRFRIFYAFFLLFTFGSIYWILKKTIGKEHILFYPLFIAFVGIESTYYWMQMLLADNIAAIAFLPVYAIILLKAFYKKSITIQDVGLVAIFSSIGLYSSLTYSYLFIIVSFSILFLYFKENGFHRPFFSLRNARPFIILAVPHLLFFLYLLITGSLPDYFYQNYVFNTKYYIYNYPRSPESSFINPVRYAILIAHWFFVNFYTLLIGVKTFDFSFPVNMTMAMGDTSLFLYLLLRKRYKLAVFTLLVMVFTNIRSNPIQSGEKDYQAGVYNFLSFFNIFFVLPVLCKSISDAKEETGRKVGYGFLMVLTALYFFFGFSHLLFKFNEKTVSKYMGDQALIYDRPQLSPIINSILTKEEYAWIGPFEFEDLFYLHTKIPSKYHILIPGVAESDKLRNEMLTDFVKNKPVIVILETRFTYLGNGINNYGVFFFDFLNKNYITLLNYKNEKIAYRSVAPVTSRVDIETKMFIRKDKVKEVVQKLLRNNYIKEINSK
ncbi:MAG: hypothetical protein HYV37_02125 [Candidatus Levyibacteriota bacterium]|nr:MAG: hypothetical protein HYV37_02125 [Candidatus Levybacteria bacterium]